MTKVIFDGECDFCRSCIAWVSNRYSITALPNQSINPAEYGITREQCDQSVVVIDEETFFAAKAVSFLLDKSGHRFAARLLKYSGVIGESGYKYVASHRDGRLVAILHWFIKKAA